MSEVVFISFGPDDYHGSPQISQACPPDPFPEIPTEEQIFDSWCEAGYNAFYWKDEDPDTENDTEWESFQKFGNFPFYYYVYMLQIGDTKVLEEISSAIGDAIIEEQLYQSEQITQEKIVSIIEGVDGVDFIIPIG